MKIETTNHGNGSPKIFGIIGFVLSIFALVFSFIPCVGYYAIVPGILSFIFSLIATIQLKRRGEGAGLFIAGIIISLLAIVIGLVQYFVFKDAIQAAKRQEEEVDKSFIEKIMEESEDTLQKTGDTLNNPNENSRW